MGNFISSAASQMVECLPGYTNLVHGLVTGALDAEVDHGVGQTAAHVELQAEVVHALGVLLVIMLLRTDPSGHQVILHSVGQGEEVVSEIFVLVYL